jgi:hypothetical protein
MHGHGLKAPYEEPNAGADQEHEHDHRAREPWDARRQWRGFGLIRVFIGIWGIPHGAAEF